MKNKPQTQSQMILNHLKKHKSINPLQALNLYGCFRLGARIFDLKEAGAKIKTTFAESKSKFGVKRYAKYVLC